MARKSTFLIEVVLLSSCSSQFKSFAYLYSEDHFITALSRDVKIVKTLPRNLKGARRKKEIPRFKAPYLASPYFYRRHVLPVLKKHLVVELVVSDGGCMQVRNALCTHSLYLELSLDQICWIHILLWRCSKPTASRYCPLWTLSFGFPSRFLKRVC